MCRSGHGNLFPFALNASPNGVSLPPPVALWWHCPQAFPVCVANVGVAFAGREIVKNVVPAIKIIAAVPQTRTNALFAFTFILVSPLSFISGPAPARCMSFSGNRVCLNATDSYCKNRFADALVKLQTYSGTTTPQTWRDTSKRFPIMRFGGALLLVLRCSFLQGVLHRGPGRVHARLHVLPS
jgi:hypothetical protein